MIDSLMEFGPCAHGMGGPVPVPFAEIEAWARVTNTELPGHEALLLRQLSRDYCEQYHKSDEPSCPAPLFDGEDSKKQAADSFRALVAEHKGGK